jgi:small-conductance mechanosensitive channel
MKIKTLVVVVLWLFAEAVVAQDSLPDVLEEKLKVYERLLEVSKKKHRDDSIKKLELLQQINTLHERDQLKHADVLRQIAEIEIRDSVRDAARKEKILSLKASTIGYPVAPFGDTLFMVYLKIGPILANERAASISSKIELLYEDDLFISDSLRVWVSESSADIMYKDLIVTSVTDWDALWLDKTKEQVAEQYLEIIRSAVVYHFNDNNIYRVSQRIGLAILIVLVAVGLGYWLNLLFGKGAQWVIDRKEKFFTGIKLRNYEFLPPRRQLVLTLQLIAVLKWFVFILILYFSLPLIFSVFPFTKSWASTLFGWVWNPAVKMMQGIVGYLPNLFSIAVIYIAIRYTIRLFRFLSKEIESGRLVFSGFHADWAAPTFSIVKFLLYAFMFVVIFPYLPGSDSAIFQGVSVFVGILFSLGSSTAIGNAVAGIVITYMRPFQIGDRVKIGEVTGDIVEKSLLVTRIKTVKNEYITVPNASILTGHTINFSTAKRTDEGVIIHTGVTIGYDVPWRKVHELLIAAAESTEGIIRTKPPFVHQKSLDDYYVAYELNAYTHEPEKMALIYSRLHGAIQDQFNNANIEILSPHYRAVRDGNESTLPK